MSTAKNVFWSLSVTVTVLLLITNNHPSLNHYLCKRQRYLQLEFMLNNQRRGKRGSDVTHKERKGTCKGRAVVNMKCVGSLKGNCCFVFTACATICKGIHVSSGREMFFCFKHFQSCKKEKKKHGKQLYYFL